MSASDTLKAYEAGLITAHEAVEQALVDNVGALYERATKSPLWRSRSAVQHGMRGMK